MELVDKLIRYNIFVEGGSPGYILKGIYLRDPPPKHPENFTVYINPKFYQQEKLDPNILINFRQNFRLYTETPVPWIQFPEFLDVYNFEEDTKFIRIKINPCLISSPGVHYARIDGAPEESCKSSRHFSIHVTVIIPMTVNIWPGYPGIDFGPNLLYGNQEIHRYFVYPPSGTSYGVIHVTNTSVQSGCPSTAIQKVVLKIDVSVLEFGKPFRLTNNEKILFLNGNEASTFYFPLQAEKLTEITIYRTSLDIGDPIPISAYIEFHGLTIQSSKVSVASAEYHHKLIVQSKLGLEKVLPYGKLFHQVQLLRPTFRHIQLLSSPRESLPRRKILNELIAEYLFHLEKPATIRLQCPLLPDCPYESDFYHLWQIFDPNKRYVGGGAIIDKGAEFKIEHKGTYTILFQLIHEDSEVLCRLTKSDASNCLSCMPQVSGNEMNPHLGLLLKLDLDENINVPAYLNLQKLAIRENELDGFESISFRSPLSCYLDVSLSDVDMDDLPGGKDTAFFTGKLYLSGDNCRLNTGTGFVPLQITMPNSPLPIKSSQNPETCTSDNNVQYYMTRTKESLNELEGKLDQLVEEFKNAKALYSDQVVSNGKEIIELCDQILNGIDLLGIQTFFGAMTQPPNSDGINDLRETIIKTLTSKGIVLCNLLKDGLNCEFSETDLDMVYKTTLLHTERTETKVRKFMIEYFMIKKLYAIAAKLLWNMRKDNLDDWTSEYHDKFTLCLYNLKMLGFVALLNDMKPVLFPPNFRPF